MSAAAICRVCTSELVVARKYSTKLLRLVEQTLYQRLSLLDVVFLPRCQDEPQRIAQSINACMHLRAEPDPDSA